MINDIDKTLNSTSTSPNPQDYSIPFSGSIIIDNLEWTTEGLYNLGNKLRDQKTNLVLYTTDGKFVEAVMIINNKTGNSQFLPSWKSLVFKIQDNQGRKYELFLSPGTRPGDSFIKQMEVEYGSVTIKPGIPYKFSIFFETAKDSDSGTVMVTVSRLPKDLLK